MVYHMPAKMHKDTTACDLMSDILGRGKASRLYDELVNQKKLFSSISSHVSGSNEPGLIMVEGKLTEGTTLEEAERAVVVLLEEIKSFPVSEEELTKVKNQAESTLKFGEIELLERCMGLAFGANLGDPDLINKESALIQSVSASSIQRVANEYLTKKNCSVLYYRSESN